MRLAVIDTNILVSALMRPEGPPGRVVAAVRHGNLAPVFNQAVLYEYAHVLRRPRLGLDALSVGTALAAFRAAGTFLHGEVPAPPAGLSDDTDWPFVACALAAHCPVITGNTRHFPITLGVRVLTAREWVTLTAG